MSVAERHLTNPPDELANARALIREENFAAALQSIAQAKANDPRNIFLIALEKQVNRLKSGGILPRERSEIVESLESLFDRAMSDGQTRVGMTAPVIATEAPDAAKKDPRLKLVVDQYFKHADEWIQRGDFEAAAKEIERVLLIDPENRVAKEYQSRVAQLLRKENPAPPPDALPTVPPLPARVAALAAQPAAAIAEPAEKKGRLWLTIGFAAVLLVAVIGTVLYLRPRQPQYKPGLMYVVQSTIPADEQTITPTTAENVPVIQEESLQAPVQEKVPEIVPPTPVKGTAKEPEVAAEKQPEKAESRPAREEPKAEPIRKVVQSTPVMPPLVPQETATQEPSASAPPVEESKPFIPVEVPPKIINLQQPQFTPDQVRAGVSGDVVVKVQIDQSGKPLQAKVISSTNVSLNMAVIDAVMNSTYSPAVMSSGPVTTWMSIPLKLK